MARVRARQEGRESRHHRVRTRVVGTTQRPRLSVYRSLKHIYAQVIDDQNGATLAAASSRENEAKPKKTAATCETAKRVGEVVAERALAKQIKNVVFDRGGFLYHGQVKALADGARAKGLEF